MAVLSRSSHYAPLTDHALGGQVPSNLDRLDGCKSRWPMRRQLNPGQVLKPFPEGII